MRLVFCITISLALLSSCAENVPDMPKPKTMIPKEKMISLLTEVMILENRAQTKYVQLSSYNKPLEKAVDSVLVSKGYSSAIFEQNMDYYGSRQEEMVEIYEQVKQQLIAKKQEVEKMPSTYKSE